MQTALLTFIDFPPEVQTVLMSTFVLLAPAIAQFFYLSLKKRIKSIEAALRENTKLTRDSLNEQKKTNSIIAINRTRHRASHEIAPGQPGNYTEQPENPAANNSPRGGPL